jgi:hypothetical protein
VCGTAGDPIEVGAAASVLQAPKTGNQPHQLLLSAFKSEVVVVGLDGGIMAVSTQSAVVCGLY